MCGSNSNGKDVNITLSVRASALYNANPQPVSQADLDAYCSLSDDNNGSIPPGVGQTLNDYTTEVYSKRKVSWTGSSSDDASYRVLINSISNNTNFFQNDPPGSSGKVTADLKDGINGVSDTYTINFTIDPPGNGTPKDYNLDPKLMGKN